MKKYSVPLVIKDRQIKTTMRYHLIPTRMTIILIQNTRKLQALVRMWKT